MRTRLHNDDGDTTRDDRLASDRPGARARGGLSAWAVLTGIMVAVGSMPSSAPGSHSPPSCST